MDIPAQSLKQKSHIEGEAKEETIRASKGIDGDLATPSGVEVEGPEPRMSMGKLREPVRISP